MIVDYPAHPYLAPAHPGGLPGWNRCEDYRENRCGSGYCLIDHSVYCDRAEDDPVHDLVAAERRAELFAAYAATRPLWPGLDVSFTAAYIPLYRGLD